MKLDKESTVSLYMQLMHVIKEQIHNGTYLEGEQIQNMKLFSMDLKKQTESCVLL